MNRAHLFAACLTGALAVGCGPKEFGSLCNEVPAPPACEMACDPLPGAANSCPAGFHCAADGKCNAQCTQFGGECGEGYACTADGYCIDDSGPPTSGPDANCPAVTFTPMPTTPSIGLVLDQSGSMFTNSFGAVTRYDAMRAALTGPQGVVTQLQDKAYFGHNQYTCSNNNNNSTLVLKETARALNNAAAIDAQLDLGKPNNSFNTPTHAAINAMVARFQATPPPAGSPPVIVLATDGEPNSCGTGPGANGGRQQSVDASAAAFAAGIPVYVLAIATGNNNHFQEVANVGQGAPQNASGANAVKYYPVNNAAELQAAFQTIINGVISCDLSLTSSIDAGQAMNGTVTVNGMQLTYGSDWTLVGGNVIRLQGAACDALKNTPNPMVSATFPCGSVIF